MQLKKTMLLLLCISISFILFTESALAWTQSYQFQSFDFSFNNPGARALGMGGAFIGVADDATATYTNPAGLTILTKPEIAAEYKYTSYKTTMHIPVGGSITEDSINNNVSGISFLSYAYPTEKATFTVFRHELVNLSTSIPSRRPPDQIFYSKNDLRVNSLGIAGALRPAKSFSLGINISFSDLDWNYTPGEPHSSNDAYHYTNSSVPHGSLGLFWNPFGEFNVGAVYRYGPRFKYTYSNTNLNVQYEDSIKIPDSYGLGFSYRFFNALTLAADVNYIKYSQLMDDFKLYPGSALSAADFKNDDTIDVSVGLEYVFALSTVHLAIRGGYHYLPDHTGYYDGPDYTARQTLFKRNDEHIFSAGIGAVLRNNFQIDFSANWSEFRQNYITSFVYRFF